MTPDQHAHDALMSLWSDMTDRSGFDALLDECGPDICAEMRAKWESIIAESCRAALRERDARWGQAVGRVAVCSECDEALAFRPVDPQCPYCADLRALLEEAAGSETAGSHGRDAGGQGAVSGWPAGAASDSLAVSAFARLVELLLDEAQDVIKALAVQTGQQRLHAMAREAAKLCAVARNMQKAALLEEAGK